MILTGVLIDRCKSKGWLGLFRNQAVASFVTVYILYTLKNMVLLGFISEDGFYRAWLNVHMVLCTVKRFLGLVLGMVLRI